MTMPAGLPADVELAIGGMTCASCAARIEKKLNRLDGVTATVNYATEKAQVSFAGGVTTDDLIATVEQTGYTARAARARRGPADAEAGGRRRRPLRQRLLVSRGADRAGGRAGDGAGAAVHRTGSGCR